MVYCFSAKQIGFTISTAIVANYIWNLALVLQHPAHPEVHLNVTEKVNKYGYHLEVHNVITEDGYILEVHRLPHKLTDNFEHGRPAILISSGLWMSSLSWIDFNGKNSLAYFLAERGYDVWLGNFRGTLTSRKHIHLDPDKDDEYWRYSIHELGIYDQSATIDYILNTTKHEKIHYIGHSQSGASFLILASEKPEYNDKIKMSILFAPAAYLGSMENSFVRFMGENLGLTETFLNLISGSREVLNYRIMPTLGNIFCRDGVPTQSICIYIILYFNGFSYETTNSTLIPLITNGTLSGGSIQQFMHILQMINSDKLRRYDYSSKEHNYKIYGTEHPPEYDFTKITAPVSIFAAEKDGLIQEKDMFRLAADLPNIVTVETVPKISHIGFFYATDIENILYHRLLKLLELH